MHYAYVSFYPGEEETRFEEEYLGVSEKETCFGELPEEDWLMRCLKDGDLVRLLKWTWHSNVRLFKVDRGLQVGHSLVKLKKTCVVKKSWESWLNKLGRVGLIN